jgi:Fungal Zn(2)-Cys(6) binuclear cluster domain/Fungal specific transcription factor domain
MAVSLASTAVSSSSLVSLSLSADPNSKNRIRRLKCGEEKPSCVRCIKSGWHCDGYEHVSKLPSVGTMGLAPIRARSLSTSPSASPTPPQSTPYAVPHLDAQEAGYFQTFFKDVAHQFQDYVPFWNYARRESKSSVCIRHGLVALGALSKSAKRSSSNHYRVDLTQGTHREFALEQYQKALQSLRESIPGINQGQPVRITLVSCLILSCFENFLGNGGFSLQHITWARHVLSTSVTSKTAPSIMKGGGEGEDIVMAGFYLMDLQALCLLGADETRTYFKFDHQSPMIPLPAKLPTLDEAKKVRHLLVWNGYRTWYQTDFYQYGPKEAIPRSVIQARDYLVRQIRALHDQIDLLLLDSNADLHLHPLARPEAIKVYSTTLLIRLAMSLQAPQTTSDTLLREFEYLLLMARRGLEYEAEGCQLIQGKSGLKSHQPLVMYFSV